LSKEGQVGRDQNHTNSTEQGGANKERKANTPLAPLTQERQGWSKKPLKEDEEKKKERDRRYRQENKERLKDYQKHYYQKRKQENKDKLNEYRRRYYQKRKEQRAADLTQREQKQHEAIQIYPPPKTR
jgi:hypothetical protein